MRIEETGDRQRPRVVVEVLCDLCFDEKPATEEPLRFGLHGTAYELDLCQLHTEHCLDQIAEMVGAARRVRGSAPAAARGSGRKSRRDPKAYDRKCPTCRALPGERCVRSGGQETGEPHATRRQAPDPPRTAPLFGAPG